jgi:hypothetical protein
MPNPDTHCITCGEPLSIFYHCWQHDYPPMDPRDDAAVSSGEVADYLDQLNQSLIKPFLMQTLTKPDTSTDVIRQGQVIGQVKCININPPSMPPAIRWFGQRPNGMPSGHARTTQAQAAQNVADWADGKDVAYVKHVELAQGAGACSRSVKLSIVSKELPL